MSFKRLDTDDFVVSADSVTAGLWTGNASELTSFYTSSTQVAGSSGNYYVNVYDSTDYDDIQFAITYGDVDGSGSEEFDSAVTGKSPSSTIYGQYRTLVLGDENAEFTFDGADVASPNFYVISIDRNRYKESIFPGATTLTLTGPNSDTITLTDNSKAVTSVSFNDAGRVFQLVSGSAGTVSDNSPESNGYSASGSYGFFLPDIATFILSADVLDADASDGGIELGTVRGDDTDSENPGRLYDAIVDGASFTANSQETITSDFVFVRPRSSEFNYSENPSFISGSTGEVIYDEFINNPQVYVTTVGLYNDNSELLAVAKLSKPLLKDFTKEALVRVKLDF
jgi:hypothetical protein